MAARSGIINMLLKSRNISYRFGFFCRFAYDKRINGTTEKIIETPKTNSSIRIIPIPKSLVTILRTLRKGAQSDYIIADKDKPLSIRSYQRSFELLLMM